MKRFRVLAVILAVLMLPIALLIGCETTDNPSGTACKTHKWGVWQRVQTRSCTTDGIRVRLCDTCGEQEIERTNAYGHDLADYVSDHNATCTEDGTKSMRCKLCEYRETAEDAGSATGHTFVVYKASEDGFTESSLCIKCGSAVDTKLLGITVDFEGDRSHLSYSTIEVFTGSLTDAHEYKTESGNTYLSVSRPAGTVIGGGAFGIVLTPRTDILGSDSAATAPSYVVEFDVRIDREKTGDLVLLSGTKKNVTESFIKYNSGKGAIESNLGTVYVLEDEDYGSWLRIAAVLNDGTKKYDIYIRNSLYASGLDYLAVDGYYLGYDLDGLKIAMANGETASSFDIDNIALYLGRVPKGEIGSAKPGYGVYVAANGEKIVYKLPVEGCEHSYSTETVAPGCVTNGYTVDTCAVCGGQAIKDEVAPVDHAFELDHVTEATCYNSKLESYVCTVCGARDAKIVGGPLGHTLVSDPELVKVTDPTCTDAGYSVGPCVRCGIEMKGVYTDALGHIENPDTVKVTAPTCTADGNTTANCARCDTVLTYDVTKALGHICSTPVKKDATCTEKGYEACVCERCSQNYTQDEVAPLGHQMVSEISSDSDGNNVIHSYCLRCKDSSVETSKPMSDTPPTPAEMEAAIGKNSLITETLYNFEKAVVGVYGKIDGLGESSGFQSFVGRYSVLEVKRSVEGNYAEWRYAPANRKGSDSVHAYWRLNPPGAKSTEGKTYVIDFSVRRTAGESEVLPFNIALEDRTMKHATGNLSTTLLKVNADGTITLGDASVTARPAATLKERDWTRVSLVVHPNVNAATTYDVFVDGVMIYNNLLVNPGNVNKMGFDSITFVAFNVTDQNVNNPLRKVDIDEIYVYYADLPVYVKDVEISNGSLMNFAEVSSNKTTEIDGVTYSYLEGNALGVGVDFNGKDNTLFYIDEFDGETGLSIVKNAATPNVYSQTGYDSHITSWGYQAFTSTLLEAELRFNEGTDMTGSFTIFQGRRQLVESAAAQAFLAFNNGWIEAGNGDKLVQVEQGKWYTVAVVVNEASENYDVYVNGYLMREALQFTAAGYTGNYSAGVAYKFMNLTGSDVNVSAKGINFQGGAQVPNLNIGKWETMYLNTVFPVENEPAIVSFSEGYNWTYLLGKDDNYIGKETIAERDGKSYLEISTTRSKDRGYNLVKIDSEGKMGDEAGEDAVWTLRTGDWKTYGVPARFSYLAGVPYVGSGYYDLSSFEKMSITMYVESAGDYQVMLKLDTKNTSTGASGGYYGYDIKLTQTGWQTFEVNLSKSNSSNYNPTLGAVVGVSLIVEGWSNGVNKQKVDGTVVYIKDIKLIDTQTERTNKITAGAYLIDDSICKDGKHSLDSGTVVAPALHVDGYTRYSCTKCDYIEIKQDVGTALGHDESFFTRDEANYKAPACETDGENYYRFGCEVCGTVTYRELLPRLGHDWKVVEGAEAEEGYEVVECTHEGCTVGQVLRKK